MLLLFKERTLKKSLLKSQQNIMNIINKLFVLATSLVTVSGTTMLITPKVNAQSTQFVVGGTVLDNDTEFLQEIGNEACEGEMAVFAGITENEIYVIMCEDYTALVSEPGGVSYAPNVFDGNGQVISTTDDGCSAIVSFNTYHLVISCEDGRYGKYNFDWGSVTTSNPFLNMHQGAVEQ